MPVGLYFDRSREVFSAFLNLELGLTLGVYAFLFFIVFRLRKKIPKNIYFFLSWFFISLLPVSQLFAFLAIQRGYITTAEHFLYIPSIGIFVMIAVAAKAIYGKKYLSARAMQVLIICFMAFLFLTTVQQNIYSSNEISMLGETLKHSPYNIRMRESLAASLVRGGLLEKAEAQYREILKIDPLHIKARISLGKVLCDQGKYWEGIREYEKTPRLMLPDAPNLVSGEDQKAAYPTISFGQTSLTRDQIRILMELLDKNLRLSYETLIQKYQGLILKEPDNARAYYSLGVVYAKINRIKDAAEQYEKAVTLDPSYKNALFNLASSYELLGRTRDAAQYYERMIELQGEGHENDKDAYAHLSRIYKSLGDERKANEYSTKAERTLEKENGTLQMPEESEFIPIAIPLP